MSEEDSFRRLYMCEWARDEEYDVAYRAWRDYYAATDAYDASVSDRVARDRHARERFKELLAGVRSNTDPKKFRDAKEAAGRDSEK